MKGCVHCDYYMCGICEMLEEAFLYIAIPDSETGWYDTGSMTIARDIGDYLVRIGRWERDPEGHGRRQWYKRKED